MKTYYTLAIYSGPPLSRQWGIHFGNYDRQVVADERHDLIDGGVSPRNIKIVRTISDAQNVIDLMVRRMNEKTRR